MQLTVTLVVLSNANLKTATKDVVRKVPPSMKLIARIFALSLVATGAIASTHIAKSAEPVVSSRVSASPVPTCIPDGTNSCGF